MKLFRALLIPVLAATLFAFGGCTKSEPGSGLDEAVLLLDPELEQEIARLAAGEEGLYSLLELGVTGFGFEIRLFLHFTPLAHEEVMAFTNPLAADVAKLLGEEVAVFVSAVQEIEGIDESRVFGESIYKPESGKVAYRHFGREHQLRHGDP